MERQSENDMEHRNDERRSAGACALLPATLLALLTAGCGLVGEGPDTSAQGSSLPTVVAGTTGSPAAEEHLFLDVHRLGPGEVTLADVAEAHAKDLAVQGAHGVDFQRYWVDEADGLIFCLAEAPSAPAAMDVHREAHGLLADEVVEVQPGVLPGASHPGARLFLDTHEAGAGRVHAEDVAEAHRKDLATQAEFGVNFLEYWVDETTGRIHCLVEAPDEEAVIATHAKAHGLVPDAVNEVVPGK